MERLTEERWAEVLALVDAGIPRREVVRQTGVTPGALTQRLRRRRQRAGQPPPPIGRPRSYTEDQLAKAIVLRNEGRSLEECATETGIKKENLRWGFSVRGVRLADEHVATSYRRRAASTTSTWARKAGHASQEDYLRSLVEAGGGELVGPVVSSKNKTTVRCSEGHTWEVLPNQLQQGQWCPHCAKKTSNIQRWLHRFVSSICPDAVMNESTLLKVPGKRGPVAELDVYVPSVNVGVELDGLWAHSSDSDSFQRGRARWKAMLAQERGIRYLMVFEDEWRDPARRPLVEAMIRLRLRRFEGRRLDARRLDLRRLPGAACRDFFQRNHLEGAALVRYAYGLYEGDVLVAAASVRTDRRGVPELARLACDRDLLVRGAAGRLVSAILKEEGRLVTYSNNRLSTGDVYRQLGFREETLSDAPSYYYTDGEVRVWRWRCRRVNEPTVLAEYPTEEAQAAGGVFSEKLFGDRRPLYRIEDCGHRRWVSWPLTLPPDPK